jgi:hypothetical protein
VGGDFRGQFNYARLLAGRGEIDAALAWLRRVPATATTAFVEKMRAWLTASPVGAFRALAAHLNAELRAPIAATMSANPGMDPGTKTSAAADAMMSHAQTSKTAGAMMPHAQESRA